MRQGEREKGGERKKNKRWGYEIQNPNRKKVVFPTKIWEKIRKVFKVVLKIGVLKYILGHKYIKAIRKKNS